VFNLHPGQGLGYTQSSLLAFGFIKDLLGNILTVSKTVLKLISNNVNLLIQTGVIKIFFAKASKFLFTSIKTDGGN